MSPRPSRMACIDALKAISSQLIVLHHLAFYGPMSDAAHVLAPGLLDWFSQYARIAVQVFLVISGFLAARSLAPGGHLMVPRPLQAIWHRYQKLVVPYTAAILIAIAGAAIARTWMHHDSIPGAPGLHQFLAHVLLLHNVLDFDALSAGVWYVAIDLQLFALLMVALWAARRCEQWFDVGGSPMGPLVVAGLALASLFWFNRDATWDIWAIYFFGAYGLGTLAFWASEPERSPVALLLLCAVVLAALAVDFRLRIAVALAIALLLGTARRGGWLEHWPQAQFLAFFGRISYSVFLVHFPICLVVNALVFHLAPQRPVLNALGMVLAWLLSNAAGALFHRYVESGAPLRALRLALWPAAHEPVQRQQAGQQRST
ncbi:acyltransferase family protein [Cupriavidus basilensis]|nr:acyltransferase family protein [Cupriavidus basilensis]